MFTGLRAWRSSFPGAVEYTRTCRDSNPTANGYGEGRRQYCRRRGLFDRAH